MNLDNDVSDQGMSWDTKGNIFGTHGLISFEGAGKK